MRPVPRSAESPAPFPPTGRAAARQLNAHQEAAGLGKEAQAKPRTKLNAPVLEPSAALIDFKDRGVRV